MKTVKAIVKFAEVPKLNSIATVKTYYIAVLIKNITMPCCINFKTKIITNKTSIAQGMLKSLF